MGSKTTYRLINHKWAEAYTGNTYLQLEKDVTLVVSRTDWHEFLKVGSLGKAEKPLQLPFPGCEDQLCPHPLHPPCDAQTPGGQEDEGKEAGCRHEAPDEGLG